MRHTAEDANAEARHFDEFYKERRGRIDPLDAVWLSRALQPSSRPLDYWEWSSTSLEIYAESVCLKLAAEEDGLHECWRPKELACPQSIYPRKAASLPG